MTFWCLKKSLPTQMDLCDPYMVPHTISWGNYNFQRSTNKIQFFDKIFTSVKKIVNLMKDLKYEHQSTFPFWGRVKLNFRYRYRKLNVFSKNSSHYQLFSSNSQKLSLWFKKNHYLPIWICMTHIWSPTLYPRAIIIFQRVQTKFHFLTTFLNTKFWGGGGGVGWWGGRGGCWSGLL